MIMNQDALIKRMGILSQACRAMAKTILDFDSILAKENSAIARSDINELELITQEKIFFGAKVEEGAGNIKKQMGHLQSMLGLGGDERDGLQVEKLLDHLQEMKKNHDYVGLDQGLVALEKSILEMSQARKAIFPKIEANAYMVKKLLQYHRETYAFWQAVAQQSEAVYGKTGKAVTGSQKSILSVRT